MMKIVSLAITISFALPVFAQSTIDKHQAVQKASALRLAGSECVRLRRETSLSWALKRWVAFPELT